MRIALFKTVKPKKFQYSPRFYDPAKEERARRRAALGLDKTLSKEENLRMKMESRWRRNTETQSSPYNKLRILIYATVVIVSLYAVFFTDMIETFLRAFGVGN